MYPLPMLTPQTGLRTNRRPSYRISGDSEFTPTSPSTRSPRVVSMREVQIHGCLVSVPLHAVKRISGVSICVCSVFINVIVCSHRFDGRTFAAFALFFHCLCTVYLHFQMGGKGKKEYQLSALSSAVVDPTDPSGAAMEVGLLLFTLLSSLMIPVTCVLFFTFLENVRAVTLPHPIPHRLGGVREACEARSAKAICPSSFRCVLPSSQPHYLLLLLLLPSLLLSALLSPRLPSPMCSSL